jgi:hypothetical protein
MADVRLIKHEAFLAIALAARFLASPAVEEEGATTGDLRSACLSHDPILHQRIQHAETQIHPDHSGNPAFRSPSMLSLEFDCPPLATHEVSVKPLSNSSIRAAASRASASRPR